MDENVKIFIFLILRRLRFHYEKTKWILLNHPRNPIVKFMIQRRANKIAEKLRKEYGLDE